MNPQSIAKPSHVRKYLNEYALIVLTMAVITLFKMNLDTNKFIREELRELVIKATVQIETNNSLLKTQK